METKTVNLTPYSRRAANVFKNTFNLLWSIIKELFKFLGLLNQRWNEAWLIVLAFIAWKYFDRVLGLIDPTVPPLPVNDLMRFLYATLGTCVVHFVAMVMLRLSHPWIFRYLYGRFYDDLYGKESTDLKSHTIKHDLQCIRLKYSLLVWSLYVVTWLVLAATY
jgi:hypothetical protein